MSDRKAMMQARLQQKSRAMNLKFASDELRRDRKVVITSVLNHRGALIYCLDDALRRELEGKTRDQLEKLLETADEDMIAKPPQPESEEHIQYEEMDFETLLQQEKTKGPLVFSSGNGKGAASAGAGAQTRSAAALTAKRTEIRTKVQAAQKAFGRQTSPTNTAPLLEPQSQLVCGYRNTDVDPPAEGAISCTNAGDENEHRRHAMHVPARDRANEGEPEPRRDGSASLAKAPRSPARQGHGAGASGCASALQSCG